MLARLCPIIVATSFALGALETGAHAQSFYYRSIPIGERAIGLGGAYTGIADDPSAAYYNPAGLMEGGEFALLGSLSSIVYTRQKIDNAFQSPYLNQDFVSDSTTTLPHFVGTVVKLGKKAFGDRRFAVAYSSFEVDRERFNVGFSDVQPDGSVDLGLNDDYRMRWWGVSFAARVKENVSVGLSAFLSSQSYGYSETIGLATGGTLNEETGVRIDGDSVTSRTAVGWDSWSFVFRLGALYRINAKWQVGFMFQPPGAPLKTSGSVFRRFSGATADGQSVYFLYDESGFEPKLRIPFELTTGARYRIDSLTTLTFDASVAGPVRNRRVFELPPEVDPLEGRIGVYFANSTERRWTPNAAIGVEHLFGKVVLAGGLFSNISAAPKVPADATEYTPDQISMFGASLAVGLDTKGYRLTLGGTGYFGRGNALRFTVDREANVVDYQRTKSNISAVVLYIAGAVSVASKGAKQVQEKYKARKAAPSNGDADTDADVGADVDANVDADTAADADADAGAETDDDR